MACKNKRYIAYPEISNQHDLDSNILKLLTGNETISGRVLYGNEDKITIQARQSMGCNDIPNLSSIDGGIVRRLRIIKFETVFTLNPIKPHEKLIKDYDKEKLKFSFLNLLLKWYPIYSSNYFIPECVKTYTDDYLKETDSIRTFCEDHIIKCDKGDSFIKKNDLKALFQTEKNNYSLGKNEQQFCKKVLNHLDIDEFKRSKKIKGKIYHDVITGYKWIAEDEENLIEDEFE